MLSIRTKESIKTALSVVIAFAIAFHMGWEKPYWAAFGVIMTSLDTNGQSLNKAAMRMLGTIVAVSAALTFVALFAQQRWAILGVLCLYIGFCTYMLAGDSRRYFWFVSGFACMIVMIDGVPTPEHAFLTAVARLQETAMGILVHSIVGLVLWPRSSRGDLEASAQELHSAQVDVYRASLVGFWEKGPPEKLRPVRIKEIQSLERFEADLEAAMLDSYEVWEVRRHWRQVHGLSMAIMRTLGRWNETFVEAWHLDMMKLLPNLGAFTAELEWRSDQIRRMLHGEPPQRQPHPGKLEIALTEVRTLSHFDRAALAALKTQLQRLEELTRALFHCVQSIKGFSARAYVAPPAPAHRKGFALDPDRLHASLTVVATLCIAYCIWIFVDPPSHSTFFFMGPMWMMVSALTRQNVTTIIPGILVAALLSFVAYGFIMPRLSGYAELGAMLFVVIFVLFWLLFEPKHRGTRTSACANFIVFISLDNHQTYDFANYLNVVAGTLLSVGLGILAQYFPFSPRPEKVFLRLLGRFFRHLEFLLTRLSVDWERERGLRGLWLTMLFRHDLLRIPARLTALADRIDYRVLPGTTLEQVRSLAAGVRAMAYRMDELLDTRDANRGNPLFLELLEDLRTWRLAIREVTRHWSSDPGASPPGDLGQRLEARIESLEKRIGEARGQFQPDALSLDQYDGVYRSIGALRALSEAGLTYADLASGINWRPWKEARF